jgi:Protein of unknown function (DUF3159)
MTQADKLPESGRQAADDVEPQAVSADDIGSESETMPTFSQQVAAQLGGVRGMLESSVPVLAFVVANVLVTLRPALIISVGTALLIAAYRLLRRQSARHAFNGLIGIGIGALIAWRTGSPKDFYLPGILLSLSYGVAMVISVSLRRPLVGWIWSVVVDNGATRWRDHTGLRRTFGWLTLVWAATYLAKVVVQISVYAAGGLSEDQKASILGITRIVLGVPPYALLLALTVWAVRPHMGADSKAAAA